MAVWLKGVGWQAGLIAIALLTPVAHPQNEIAQFEIDVTLGDTDFDLIPGVYHKVPVTVDIVCKVWSPIMQTGPMNFDNNVRVEGVPEKKTVSVKVDDPIGVIIFTASDCIEGTVKSYSFNVTIRANSGFEAFVPFTFYLDVVAKNGTGEDQEKWEMRTDFAGDIYFTPRSPYRVTNTDQTTLTFGVGNSANADIAGRVQMNESQASEITMKPVEFGPIPYKTARSVAALHLPIQVSEAAVADPGLYSFFVDASAYLVVDPGYPVPVQTVEFVIDTRPYGWEDPDVQSSSGLVVWSLLVVIALLALRFRRAI
ncbi:MAG: hypothetical protein KY455_02065 [Euryarchaeota archaeon]|nr:hypothetical protein [Euryarchaeota archaeon]